MSRNAHHNANNRRSGGDRLGRIVVGGEAKKDSPRLAIQCFEQRHHECTGLNTLFGCNCECSCHSAGDKHGS
jgi:hypothetical protein